MCRVVALGYKKIQFLKVFKSRKPQKPNLGYLFKKTYCVMYK